MPISSKAVVRITNCEIAVAASLHSGYFDSAVCKKIIAGPPVLLRLEEANGAY